MDAIAGGVWVMDIGASFIGDDMVCPVCGKVFLLTSYEWVYKVRVGSKSNITRYICSWKCLRKWEKENGKVQRERLYISRCKEQMPREGGGTGKANDEDWEQIEGLLDMPEI